MPGFLIMLTPQQFLDIEIQKGISADNLAFQALADATVRQLTFDYTSVLDYGAGTGVYSHAFYKAGKDVHSFDIWQPHREYIKSKFPNLTIVDKPITTDLMAFIEVAEHMTDKEINALFKQINPKFILFSSTSEKTDFDAEWGHINVKPQSEWVELFDRLGYEFFTSLKYPTSWAKLFIKK